jgi:peptide alpha-N-acetyltransferase
VQADDVGSTFEKLARAYLIAGLEKGVPSLFVDVKGLYRDASKMAAVGAIAEDLIVQLENEKLHEDG